MITTSDISIHEAQQKLDAVMNCIMAFPHDEIENNPKWRELCRKVGDLQGWIAAAKQYGATRLPMPQ